MLKALNTKLLGGTLLLAGTAMGGGLLALPLATAETGFWYAALLMIFCWAIMTASALITLEASLWLPPGSNIISMSATLLNPAFTYIAWGSYLLLFYSITAAYIASGSDFLSQLGRTYCSIGYLQPIAAISFTVVFGSIVSQGIHWIDYLNRQFMIIKLLLYMGLVTLILPHATPTNWLQGDIQNVFRGFTIVITSFSYANMIPSLRSYFSEDIKSLRKAILIGGTMPLICYLLWNMSVMGMLPLSGENGLIHISQSDLPASRLIQALNHTLEHPAFYILSHSFSYVCILTTFLTCSFGLSDFLADGLGLVKRTSLKNDLIIYGATFLPPLFIALFFPGIFIQALHYAGIYCLILFVLIPTLLVWNGRYHLKYPDQAQLKGGKSVLILLSATAVIGIIYSVYRLFF